MQHQGFRVWGSAFRNFGLYTVSSMKYERAIPVVDGNLHGTKIQD